MKELKRSAYSYMSAGVVASRDYLCIRPDLKKASNTDKSYVCQSLMAKKKPAEKCHFHENGQNMGLPQNSILDIEDLDQIGRKENICPFYLSKDLVKRANIIFLPYNYILDPKVRGRTNVDLKNAIIILDEGHNVEKMCEESACTHIKSTKIGIATRDIDYVSKIYRCFFLISNVPILAYNFYS